MTSKPVISVKHLTKKFAALVAVNEVDLEVKEGECYGLLGPNGSGKTSLIRVITGVSPLNGGSIHVLGLDLQAHAREVKACLGVVPQTDNLDEDLLVFENLTTFARYFDIPGAEARRRAEEVLAFFHLQEKRRSRIRELSGGMRRRLLIARALINQPRIIILDEPTVGLDPQARHLVWQKLTALKKQGTTQFLTTHNMDEAAVLCDRVAIMHMGRILSEGSPGELIVRHVGEHVIEIEVSVARQNGLEEKLAAAGLEFVPGESTIEVFHADRARIAGLLDSDNGRVRERPGNLEDVFFRLTGRGLVE